MLSICLLSICHEAEMFNTRRRFEHLGFCKDTEMHCVLRKVEEITKTAAGDFYFQHTRPLVLLA